ncbi:hypothetical protein MASR1M48_17200 [Lactococcus petauri]
MEKTIHQQLKDAGITTFAGHFSDLYVPVNEVTTKIIDGYKYKKSVTKFINRVQGGLWYDIPFAHDDYYKKREPDEVQKQASY